MENRSGTRLISALSAAEKCTYMEAGLPCSVTCALDLALVPSVSKRDGTVAPAAVTQRWSAFLIVKNFNEKVIGAIRKDEHQRLADEGNTRAAAVLKKTKYILTSSRDTLRRKDEEAAEGKVISRGGELFPQPVVVRKSGYVQRCEELIRKNQLFFYSRHH
ncbi:MAG: hypothetical protein LUD54_07100 [Oscillospiraceae bacterium]|nr:hypothetical protein [Oscillospiraceae bacterium]